MVPSSRFWGFCWACCGRPLTSSTRRFFCRPSGVVLSAIGSASPHGQQLRRGELVVPHEVLLDAAGPALRELKVVAVAPHAIGVPFDLNAAPRQLRRLERLGG